MDRGGAQTAVLARRLDAQAALARAVADAWVAPGVARWSARAKCPAGGLDFPLVAAPGFLWAAAAVRELPVAMGYLDVAGQLLGRLPQVAQLTAV